MDGSRSSLILKQNIAGVLPNNYYIKINNFEDVKGYRFEDIVSFDKLNCRKGFKEFKTLLKTLLDYVLFARDLPNMIQNLILIVKVYPNLNQMQK